jgi:hypothetical protein
MRAFSDDEVHSDFIKIRTFISTDEGRVYTKRTAHICMQSCVRTEHKYPNIWCGPNHAHGKSVK